MKLAVLSDTHGNYPGAIRALSGCVDLSLLVHLGDFRADGVWIGAALELPVLAVSGNCDPHDAAPRELVHTLAGTRILITHGDLFQVKRGLGMLLHRAQQVGAGIVLFGHTHNAALEMHQGILFVNPGCLLPHKYPGGYALLHLENGEFVAELVTDAGEG